MESGTGTGFTLRIETGKRKGQVFHFGRASVRIGREEPCDLILDDDTVSRHHATIRSDGEQFLLSDEHSANGTFLNGQRIHSAEKLTHEDVIGFGPDQRVRFAEDTAGLIDKEGRRQQAAAGSIAQVGEFLRQKPALAAGLGVYAVGIIALFFYLAFSSSDQERLTAARAEQLVKETEQFLASTLPSRKDLSGGDCAMAVQLLVEGRRLEETEAEDPGAPYIAVVKYRQALRVCGYPSLSEYKRTKASTKGETNIPAQAARALEGALARIRLRLQEHLFQGWQAESRGQDREALRIYERVLTIVPEQRAPSYRFALGRIRELRR